MPKAIDVKNVCLHCSAGFADIYAVQRFWATKWQFPYGYHWFVDIKGKIFWLTKDGTYSEDESKVDFTKITNGVKGYNRSIISGCYQGGVEKVGNKWIAKDTRTPEQIFSIEYAIKKSHLWLNDNGKDLTKDLGLVGHRDYSIDGNKNGVIDSWERNKECPSHDVIGTTLHYLYSSPDRYGKLPYN